MLNSRIGSYRIIRKLGEGGMGAVYEALHEAIERRVAIKVLHPEFAKSPDVTMRFFNEARVVNRVEHPGLVQISDYGQLPDGTAYIVMEYLRGETLSSRMQRSGGSLSNADVLQFGALIAETLEIAHEKGIVHRDLKPDNVMIVTDPQMPGGERPKLLDFGIAKLTDATNHSKTRTNALMGTPLYMSPEQCRGAKDVDERADVYSFGAMLFAMACGQPPFNGEGMGEILGKHMYEDPPQLQSLRPTVAKPLADLVHAMLRKDRHQRPSMAQVAGELNKLLSQTPMPPKRRSGMDLKPLPAPAITQPADTPSALGQSAARTHNRNGLRRQAAYFLGGAAILGIGTSGYLLSQRNSTHRPDPVELEQLVYQAQVLQPNPKAVIHWSVDTDPSGATVIREADGTALGETPWQINRVAAVGREKIILRLPGYAERRISLSREADENRQEPLDILSTAQVTPIKTHVVPNPVRPAVSLKRASRPGVTQRPPVISQPMQRAGHASGSEIPAKATHVSKTPTIED